MPTAPCIVARPSAALVDLTSGNDVGGQLVLKPHDPVLQDELALLQPLDLELVSRHHPLEGLDGSVKVAMLLLQPGQLRLELGCVVDREIQGRSLRA